MPAPSNAQSIGDAVLTFVGDTTQLDLAFAKVEGDAATKLKPAAANLTNLKESFTQAGESGKTSAAQISDAWQRVAQATQNNQLAQKQLTQALNMTKASGDEDVVAMLALAEAQKKAALASAELAAAQRAANYELGNSTKATREAKGEMALMGEMTGVRIPRHLRSFVAELPGVGAALSAAFSATAVLILLQIIGQVVSKIEEWSEASEKLRQDQINLAADFSDNSLKMQQDIDKSQAKFIELTEGPVAGLDYALKHIAQTAFETLHTINGEIDKTAQVLQSQAWSWNPFSAFKDASKELKSFGADLVDIAHKAQQAAPTDSLAPYQAMLDATGKKVKELSDKIEELRQLQEDPEAVSIDLGPMEQELEALQKINAQLKLGKELQEQRTKEAAQERATTAASHALEVGSAQIAGAREVEQARIALAQETNKVLLQTGQQGFDQYLAAERVFEQQRNDLEESGLRQRLALLQKDPVKNEAQIIETNKKLESLESQHQLSVLKLDEQGFQHRNEQFVKFMEFALAETKQGSQERVDLELGLSEFYRQTYGAESDQYLQSLVRIEEARHAWTEEQRREAETDRKNDEALANDKLKASSQYYQYLVQTARLSAAQMRIVQRDLDEQNYQSRKASLDKQLKSLGPDEVLARKQVLGQLNLLNQQYEENKRLYALQSEDDIEAYYTQLGIKSADMLQREQDMAREAYDAIELDGTSAYGDILKAKQKLLSTDLNVARSFGNTEEITRITAEVARLEALMEKLGITAKKTENSMVGWLDSVAKRMQKSRGELTGYQANFDTVMMDAASVAGEAFAKFAQGQESFGQALKEGLAQEAATIAGKALMWSLYFLAWGIADTFWNPARAGADFASAAEFAAVAAIAGGAAYGLSSGGGGKGSSSGGSSGQDNTATKTQLAEQQPVTTSNVQKFAGGGLVTGPTMAMLGDSMRSTSGQTEAAIPLDDPQAVAKIVEALGGGGPNLHVYVEGLVSPDNLNKVVRKMSKAVGNGKARLVSSNALRVTRKG